MLTVSDALREGWVWDGLLEEVEHGLHEGCSLGEALESLAVSPDGGGRGDITGL